jgi:thioredoxin 1
MLLAPTTTVSTFGGIFFVPGVWDRKGGEAVSRFIDVDENTFDNQVLKSHIPAVVEFGAPWCGPCKQMEPVLEAMAERTAGKMQLFKVEVDHNPRLTQRFGVMGAPTVFLFVGGVMKERIIGYAGRDKVESKLMPYLR